MEVKWIDWGLKFAMWSIFKKKKTDRKVEELVWVNIEERRQRVSIRWTCARDISVQVWREILFIRLLGKIFT